MARCPAHYDGTPSLSIKEGEGGRLLLYCHAGCAYSDVLAAVQNRAGKLLGAPVPAVRHRQTGSCPTLAGLIRRLWSEAKSIEGTHAEGYLRARAIAARPPPTTLRFHPRLRHPCGDRLPAMVACVEHVRGGFVGLHRTYLHPSAPQKTSRSPAKAMLGRCRGASVRLTTGSDGLAVCEGIETGLSLAAGLDAGLAVWAALSTSGVVGLGLPEPAAFARALLIATDGDAAGWRAGEALADRAATQGWRVEIVSAPAGRDFNDLARMDARG
jgi:hypothetical protein